MVEEKEKEGNELKASIEESNVESQDNIGQIRRKTQNNIKVRTTVNYVVNDNNYESEVRVGE